MSDRKEPEDTPIFWSMVRRIETERGSYVLPPFRLDWSELDKLRWQAATVRVDAGVSVTVRPSEAWSNGVEIPDLYGLSTKWLAMSGQPYLVVSDVLDGIEIGAETVRREFSDV